MRLLTAVLLAFVLLVVTTTAGELLKQRKSFPVHKLRGDLSRPQDRAHLEHLGGKTTAQDRKELRQNYIREHPRLLKKMQKFKQEHPDYKQKIKKLRERIVKKKDISEMFHFCDEARWALTKQQQMFSKQITAQVENIRKVKCAINKPLNMCLATINQKEQWTCVLKTCGSMLETIVQKAGSIENEYHRKKLGCTDVTTSEGKMRCAFEQIILAKTCHQLGALCGGYAPLHTLLAEDGTTICPQPINYGVDVPAM